MLSINVFRGASEQHCFKIGVWRATLIQRTRHLDSIVARALLVADFIDSIGQKPWRERSLPAAPGTAVRTDTRGKAAIDEEFKLMSKYLW